MSNNLRTVVDNQLVKAYIENAHTPQDFWRISGLGMPWDSYWRRKQAQVDIETMDPNSEEYATAHYDIARSQLVMALGTGAHDIINDLVEASGEAKILFIDHKDHSKTSRFEVVDEELNCVGHPDIGVLLDNGILYDIKSVNSNAFSHMKKEGGGVIKAYDHHVKQITKYFDRVRKLIPEITEMRLLYISRDDGRREEIPVPFDPMVLAAADEEFKYLNSQWDRNEPPAPPELNSFQHRYSNYKHLMPESYKTTSNA